MKSGLKALAVRLAEELRRQRIAVVAVVAATPGLLRSESMLERFGVTAESWRDGGKKDPNSLESEMPLFLGGAGAGAAGPLAEIRRRCRILPLPMRSPGGAGTARPRRGSSAPATGEVGPWRQLVATF